MDKTTEQKEFDHDLEQRNNAEVQVSEQNQEEQIVTESSDSIKKASEISFKRASTVNEDTDEETKEEKESPTFRRNLSSIGSEGSIQNLLAEIRQLKRGSMLSTQSTATLLSMGLPDLHPVRFHSKVSRENALQNNFSEWVPIEISKQLKGEADRFVRISTINDTLPDLSPFIHEHQYSAKVIKSLLDLRDKYLSMERSDYFGVKDVTSYKSGSLEPYVVYDAKSIKPVPMLQNATYTMKGGIFVAAVKDTPLASVVKFEQYAEDYLSLVKFMQDKKLMTFTYSRIQLLEKRFELHKLYNSERELTESKTTSHRDFYNVRKVDTHVHHSACMHPKHLLLFVREKVRNEPDLPVFKEKDGKIVTLKEMFQSLGVNPNQINVDLLDVQATNTFQRFDRFNQKYSPLGKENLRSVFLKYDNMINGRFLAEITREVINRLEANKYEFVEWRASIYGKSKGEWKILAKWIYDNNLISHNVRWMVQAPRIYSILKVQGVINSFQDILANFFEPLFEVTIDPSKDPNLYNLLLGLSGFDSVDDESAPEDGLDFETKPGEWNSTADPPYYYWLYYFYANVYNLNALRKKQGLNTFQFRPHCGEAGDPNHLAAAFLVADSINHGIMLHKTTVLQYLYYLKQIGLAMSPVSNNRLFLEYSKQPFKKFFDRGLNVSLSTDDPLLFHNTKEPLLEEYSIASQIWNLTSTDLCEIARNSVLQSGYETNVKIHWIGDYRKKGIQGNEILKTNLPYSRYLFRSETLESEHKHLNTLVDLKLESL